MHLSYKDYTSLFSHLLATKEISVLVGWIVYFHNLLHACVMHSYHYIETLKKG